MNNSKAPSSYTFRFGGNLELLGCGSGGHHLEPLLYDAHKGIYLSRLYIFDYYVGLVKAGRNVPMPIALFVASNIEDMIDGKLPPKDLFHPIQKSKRIKAIEPIHYQLVDGRDKQAGDIHQHCEQIGAMLHKSGKAIEEKYYLMKGRIERLRKVNEILLRWYSLSNETWEEKEALSSQWFSELQEIYKEPSKLV